MRFLGKLAPARVGELYKRVADEINTTFAIESTVELTFEEAMTPEVYIKLTRTNLEYTVSVINNRDSRMILKKISLRSPFPFIRGYAASVRIARCYISLMVHLK